MKAPDQRVYQCTRCGRIAEEPDGSFYVSPGSLAYRFTRGYTHICKACVNELFDMLTERLHDKKMAALLVCHYLDKYFSEPLYEQCCTKDFNIGTYLKKTNILQFKGKTFMNTVQELLMAGLHTEKQNREVMEAMWGGSDLKNKNYVLSAVGYDCFTDESYTDEGRKFLFNTLADYLTDDVLEDQHKLQCVISMVKTSLQVEEINKLINAEIRKPIIDSMTIDKYTAVKDKLTKIINSTANENAISAKTSGKGGRGSNTLTHIMKEMQELGFEEAKADFNKAKLSESYREIAEDNAEALVKRLRLTGDEYADMVAVQSKKAAEMQKEIDRLKEENRQLLIKLKLASESE